MPVFYALKSSALSIHLFFDDVEGDNVEIYNSNGEPGISRVTVKVFGVACA